MKVQEDYILVTGGAGFIGAQLCAELRKSSRVIVLDNLSPQIHNKATFEHPDDIRFDITKDDFSKLNQYGMPLAIFHLAAETGTAQSMYQIEHYYTVNVTGTARVLEFALSHRNVLKKFFFASSRSVYGEGTYVCSNCYAQFRGVREKSQLDLGHFEVFSKCCNAISTPEATCESFDLYPASHYANSKAVSENMVRLCLEGTNIEFCNFRFQNVYGIGQSLANPYTGILGILSSLAINNRDLHIYENGLIYRDFVSVVDVVSILLQSLKLKSLPHILNVGTGEAISIYDLALFIVDFYRSDSKVIKTDAFRVGDIAANFCSNELFFQFFPDFQYRDFWSVLPSYLKWVKDMGGMDIGMFEKSVSDLTKEGLFKT